VLGEASGIVGTDVIRGGRFDLSKSLDLAPRTALVLEVER